MTCTPEIYKKKLDILIEYFNFILSSYYLYLEYRKYNLKEYDMFFMTTQESLRKSLLIEIAKFFDDDYEKKSLSIIKILKTTEDNIPNLKKWAFLKIDEIYSTKDFILHWNIDCPKKIERIRKQFIKRDKEFIKKDIISLADIEDIRKDLELNNDIISRIITYRNTYLAHNQEKREYIPIEIEEIWEIVKLIEKIITLICVKSVRYTFGFDTIKYIARDQFKEIIKLIHKKKIKKN